MSNHPIVHVEFSANDPNESGKFYEALFGWKIQFQPEMDYVLYETGSGPGGGFAKVDNQMYKAGDTLVYVNSDDIDASLTKVEALGGKTLVPKSEIPGIGWFAIFSDPTGNRLGLFTALSE